jgi:hypothetical protein
MADCSDLTDEYYASGYYRAIGAEDANGNPNFNFAQWKQLFGYDTSTPVRAVYGNRLDLQFGRDMNCWEPSGTRRVVCFVTNYGAAAFANGHESPSWPALVHGTDLAGEGDINKSLATVAMVYDPDGLGPYHNETIGYYAFGPTDGQGNQPLIRSVALDGEGPKTVPAMCQSCHAGGSHGGLNHGDNFLPFDVQSFFFLGTQYDEGGNVVQDPTYTLDNQQENFRQLNALVVKAAGPAIGHLINGWYAGAVNTPGATVPDDTYIPAGWDGDKISRNMYRHVYRPYCRTCHVAQVGSMAFEKITDLDPDKVASQVCSWHSMPNAEVAYGSLRPLAPRFGFWGDGVAKSDLDAYLSAAKGFPVSCQ